MNRRVNQRETNIPFRCCLLYTQFSLTAYSPSSLPHKQTTQLICNFGKSCKAQGNTRPRKFLEHCLQVLENPLRCAPCQHSPFAHNLPGRMGNHSTSLSSPIITILLSSELESDTFSKTFQITPLLGFSTNHSGQISALCLSALIDWMSLEPVKSACSSAVSQSWWCQPGAWLELAGLEGSYHSCQITDSLTPTLPTFSYCIWFLLSSLDLS